MSANVDADSYVKQVVARGVVLVAVRLGMLLLCSTLIWLILRSIFEVVSFPPTMLWAHVALLPVNIVCFVMVRRWYRGDGKTLAEVLGIRKGRVGRDLLWGLLWLFVLNVPFSMVVAGTVFAMYGTDAPQAFETIFYDVDAAPTVSPVITLVLSVLVVLPFMVMNAPAEELVFRGYGLAGISRLLGPAFGIVITSLLFGAQHILFASTVPGMVVYFTAFTAWGIIAAIIVRRQGRLFPVVVAHWMVNIMMAAPGIVFPVLMSLGIIDA